MGSEISNDCSYICSYFSSFNISLKVCSLPSLLNLFIASFTGSSNSGGINGHPSRPMHKRVSKTPSIACFLKFSSSPPPPPLFLIISSCICCLNPPILSRTLSYSSGSNISATFDNVPIPAGPSVAIPVEPINACGQRVDSLYFRKHLCTT
uniref:Uncharacterized protein n=1 Tax=Candidatus Methanogaster sp. ANME-2c ERB4 TaxID=2759911 RepID=A0A7G9YIZ6_9EURY|nr:hypothetical protein KNONPEEI_00018 [Methanosarcinales archaeon ANME-2c ERB4]QNO48163.1 hypothetical protein GOJLPIDM_00019 [Methanosarcinales archaeon ANME-2c ERB4]